MESELPKYKCRRGHAFTMLSTPRSHVHAAKIESIAAGDGVYSLSLEGDFVIDVEDAIVEEHAIAAGGFFLVLSDGTHECLPAAHFAGFYEPDELDEE